MTKDYVKRASALVVARRGAWRSGTRLTLACICRAAMAACLMTAATALMAAAAITTAMAGHRVCSALAVPVASVLIWRVGARVGAVLVVVSAFVASPAM